MTKKQYNDDSIKSLKGAERVRVRPGVMFGTDGLSGAFHTVKEILGNSLDEARAGFGSKIIVTHYKDNSISIEDDGRGVPMAWNEAEERYNWDLIFNELYAGGKYDDEGGDYEFSIGLNGLGSASTQYTSDWMTVVSKREGNVYEKSFKDGIPTEDEMTVVPNTDNSTGTKVHWKVSNDVFTSTAFTSKMFHELLEAQAHLNNLTIVFNDEISGSVTEYKGEGIEAYLLSQVNGNVVDTFNRQEESHGVEKGKRYKVKADIVLAITDEEVRTTQLHFHNTGAMKSGVHLSAFDSAITTFFRDLSKQHNVKVLPIDYSGYIHALTSTYSNRTSFANQTKDGVSNDFIASIVYNTILDILEEGVAMKRESIQNLVENVINSAIARQKAKEIEQQTKLANKLSSTRKAKPEKFAGCSEKDPKKRELFIPEGDSAKGACKAARDRHTQALLPIRGKIINALKAPLADVLANSEVQDIINVIGAGVDLGEKSTFDIKKVQYSKVIFATDADVDGYQIRVLLYLLFYRLMPEMLRQGMVYVAETPLYEIITREGSVFAYSVDEYNEITEDLKARGVAIKKVNRSKGLGENDPDMLWNTTMNPESRRLVQLNIDPTDSLTRSVTDMVFGNDPTKERKDFVYGLLAEVLGDDTIDSELVKSLNELEQTYAEDEVAVEVG